MIDLAILLMSIGFTFVMVVGTLLLCYLAYKSMKEW